MRTTETHRVGHYTFEFDVRSSSSRFCVIERASTLRIVLSYLTLGLVRAQSRTYRGTIEDPDGRVREEIVCGAAIRPHDPRVELSDAAKRALAVRWKTMRRQLWLEQRLTHGRIAGDDAPLEQET